MNDFYFNSSFKDLTFNTCYIKYKDLTTNMVVEKGFKKNMKLDKLAIQKVKELVKLNKARIMKVEHIKEEDTPTWQRLEAKINNNKTIAIYEDTIAQNIAHIVDTLEEASQWLGCTRDTLYKSLHLHGVMKAKGYIVERIEL